MAMMIWMVAAYRRTHRSCLAGLAATWRCVCIHQMTRENSQNGAGFMVLS